MSEETQGPVLDINLAAKVFERMLLLEQQKSGLEHRPKDLMDSVARYKALFLDATQEVLEEFEEN